ncbi:hypothetical protein KA005_76655 [bacterium]|nr:hypothetical protein [bacterium]
MTVEEKDQSKNYVRPKDVQVRIASDADEKLITMTQRYKFNKKVALSVIIDRAFEIDLLRPGYTERAEALKDAGDIQLQKNRFEGLENAPRCLAYLDDCYKCVVSRLDKSPDIKKLSKDLDEALDACSKCEEGKVILRELEKAKIQNIELIAERGRDKVLAYPICARGARPSEDLTEMIGCELPHIGGRNRPIKERKKKSDPPPCHKLGSPTYERCQNISWTQITIRGEIKALKK